MSQILADLVRAQRVRTNAEQLARWSDPTPDGLEASPGYIPGFRAARNRRLPRPEFREINRGIPIDQLRQSIVEERKVLRAMLQGAGVESRTCAPDPTIRIAKPWSTEFRHNDELRPNSAEAFDRRLAEHNRLVAERRAQAFERQARAFYEAMNP